MDYYSITDLEGWNDELAYSWLIHGGQFTYNCQPQIGHRSAKFRRPIDRRSNY